MNTVSEERSLYELDYGSTEAICLHLHDIIKNSQLTAVFQPILDMHQGKIIGFEGLIRGPVNSVLHPPIELFRAASACGKVAEVEYLARRIVLENFAKLGLAGKVFLNISPDILLQRDSKNGVTLKYIEELGLQPSQVIIELTENAQSLNYELLWVFWPIMTSHSGLS